MGHLNDPASDIPQTSTSRPGSEQRCPIVAQPSCHYGISRPHLSTSQPQLQHVLAPHNVCVGDLGTRTEGILLWHRGQCKPRRLTPHLFFTTLPWITNPRPNRSREKKTTVRIPIIQLAPSIAGLQGKRAIMLSRYRPWKISYATLCAVVLARKS